MGSGELWDPWILLASMATATERVRLGAMVFAPTRRRPWKLAREITTLDRLSGGRLVVPVGLGALEDAGFGNVGEPTAARTRAELLDETLSIIDGLATGQPFGFEGEHYRFDPMTFQPTPVQRPRVPVWVVGAWPHSGRCGARSAGTGWSLPGSGRGRVPSGAPPNLEEIATWIAARRLSEGLMGPFEVVVGGATPGDEPDAAAATVRRFEEAGATWWVEADWENASVDALRARIAAGPPRG